MKKFLTFLCSVTLVFGMVASAGALQFTLDEYTVNLNTVDPGLRLYSDKINESLSFPLEVDQSTSWIPLFTLGTTEDSITWREDTEWRDISVDFDFSSPDILSDATGRTRGRVLWDDGIVRWDNPAIFNFGETGSFNIYLSNADFDTPGSATIFARFQYVSADSAAPVPEPSTILLMGVGLLGLVGYGRRRLKK